MHIYVDRHVYSCNMRICVYPLFTSHISSNPQSPVFLVSLRQLILQEREKASSRRAMAEQIAKEPGALGDFLGSPSRGDVWSPSSGYAYMYVCLCNYIHIYIYIHTYIGMHMYVCMHACMYVCMYVCMYLCVCVYIYTYTYVYVFMCIYTYTYMYMYICIWYA